MPLFLASLDPLSLLPFPYSVTFFSYSPSPFFIVSVAAEARSLVDVFFFLSFLKEELSCCPLVSNLREKLRCRFVDSYLEGNSFLAIFCVRFFFEGFVRGGSNLCN